MSLPFIEVIKIAEEHIGSQEKKMESEAIYNAYQKLPNDDRRNIERLAKRLVIFVCKQLPLTTFDFYDALEVIAKIGIYLNLRDTSAGRIGIDAIRALK